MDGTSGTTFSFDRLKGGQVFHCFDLQSATDLFPLRFMVEVVTHQFGRQYVSSVGDSALSHL